MDGRQLIVQRTREFFAERLDDVLHMVRQDRQEMRGWQEPAHLRAVIRRSVREGGSTESETTTATTAELDLFRAAGEPDRGQQREAIGQLLEAGANGLERIARQGGTPELSFAEQVGLEIVLLLYARPALLIDRGNLAAVPPFWNILEDQREAIELAQRGVGRIDLLGHPDVDWAGTGFLVNETTLLTTRRVAELFVENSNGQFQFRPGISAWMDYRSQEPRVAAAGYRVRGVRGMHEVYDLALLEVEPPQVNGSAPVPLQLAAYRPERFENRPVYLISYPVRDSRRNESERISRIFRDSYAVKRVQPGQIRGEISFRDVRILQHDCAPLGLTTGAPLIDLETQQVIGVQVSSRYLEVGSAVPLYALRDDAMFQRCGVTFCEANPRERETTMTQLERLARTRYWGEARGFIAELYRRAFGRTDGSTMI